jgi:tetratricopeptide (TPR) repeat protein
VTAPRNMIFAPRWSLTRFACLCLLVPTVCAQAPVPITADSPDSEAFTEALLQSIPPVSEASASDLSESPSATDEQGLGLAEALTPAELLAEDDEEPPEDSAEVSTFREAIELTESLHGAFAPELPEQLLGLGTALQQQGRHAEALPVFKRGVHLARIQHGLYSDQQLPLLKAEIESLLAMRDFSQADERQDYRWRVEEKALQNQVDTRLESLLEHAEWHRQAYVLGVDSDPQRRLLLMWQTYRDAISLVADKEGDFSPRLIPPLQGLFVAQYLISAFRPGASGGVEMSFNGGYNFNRTDQHRFNSARAGSFKQGDMALLAWLDVERIRQAENNLRLADIQVLRGDWALLHNRREDAMAAYQMALSELAELEDHEQQFMKLFGEPIPLPTINPLQSEYAPSFTPQGRARLRYDVTERGRARNVKVLEADDPESYRVTRLLRDIKSTQFRPRFEQGEPVATNEIVKTYAY